MTFLIRHGEAVTRAGTRCNRAPSTALSRRGAPLLPAGRGGPPDRGHIPVGFGPETTAAGTVAAWPPRRSATSTAGCTPRSGPPPVGVTSATSPPRPTCPRGRRPRCASGAQHSSGAFLDLARQDRQGRLRAARARQHRHHPWTPTAAASSRPVPLIPGCRGVSREQSREHRGFPSCLVPDALGAGPPRPGTGAARPTSSAGSGPAAASAPHRC
jgi:hypothetical protein